MHTSLLSLPQSLNLSISSFWSYYYASLIEKSQIGLGCTAEMMVRVIQNSGQKLRFSGRIPDVNRSPQNGSARF